MGKLEWKESYNVDNGEIDKQHKHLFEIYNKLIDKLDSTDNSRIITNTLTEMTKYADYHFAIEERYMKLYGYPESKEHKKEHVDYIKRLSKLNFNSMDRDNNISEDVVNYLKQWLLAHILHSDLKLKTFFNSKNKAGQTRKSL